MNTHFISGLIAFLLWSTFSTWYYINNIWESDDSSQNIVVAEPIQEAEPAEQPTMAEDSTSTPSSEPEPVFTESMTSFLFTKNEIQLLDKTMFINYLDSISNSNPKSLAIEIVGHTCDMGREEFNLSLSQKRAEFIESELKGVLSSAETSVTYKGESEPRVPNNSEENRQKNRRVTIKVRTES